MLDFQNILIGLFILFFGFGIVGLFAAMIHSYLLLPNPKRESKQYVDLCHEHDVLREKHSALLASQAIDKAKS